MANSSVHFNKIVDPDSGREVATDDIVDGSSVVTSTGEQTLVAALDDRATVDALDQLRSDALLGAALTVNIPTDYATLQGAIDDLSMLSVKQGVTIELFIEAGHALTDGVTVKDGEYGHFVVRSADATVLLDASYPPSSDLFRAENATNITLDCLVNMDGKGKEGYVLRNNSRGFVTPGSGVEGADVCLRVLSSSTVSAESTIFRNAIEQDWGRNVWVSSSSLADLNNKAGEPVSDLSGAAQRNVYVSRASVCNLHGANISSSMNDNNLYVIRSRANAQNADLTNAGQNGMLAASGSSVNIQGADCSGAASDGFRADSSSIVNADGLTASNCGAHGVSATSSLVDVSNSTLSSNTLNGILAAGCCSFNAESASITGNGNRGVQAQSGSRISLQDASVTGSTNDDINCQSGSNISAFGCSTTNGVGTPSVGDTNFSSLNTIEGNKGIIWG